MIKSGFAREVITPERGFPLAGYFNPRYNRGALDNLYVKAALFEKNDVVGGAVTFDCCSIQTELVDKIVERLKAEGMAFAENVLFSATHSHTAPNAALYSENEKAYSQTLIDKAVSCVGRARADLSEAALSVTRFNDNPFAFNRRYYMKSGKVVTNPGKLNPDIVRPESLIDDEIGVLAVSKEGRTTALIVNIVNHSDTIGGDLVSADWPGRMERALQNKFGYDVDVMTLIGCGGNINHFDVKSKRGQTSYKEATKIGKGYAGLIFARLDALEQIADTAFRVDKTTLIVDRRTLSSEEIDKARKIVEGAVAKTNKNLTSEDLAKGDTAVERFFAEQILKFAALTNLKSRDFPVVCLKFGDDLGIVSLPGEPFTEIGLAIKAKSPFRTTFIVGHGMGKAGYIPLKECFARGGYETLPVEAGGCAVETAERYIAVAAGLLTKK